MISIRAKSFGIVDLINGNVLACTVGTAQGTLNVRSNTGMLQGTWSHIACTYDEYSGMLKIYMDGEEEGFEDGSDNMPILTNNEDILMGCPLDLNPDDCYEGLLDEVELFDRALTQTEIREIYEADSYGKCKCENECGDGHCDIANVNGCNECATCMGTGPQFDCHPGDCST